MIEENDNKIQKGIREHFSQFFANPVSKNAFILLSTWCLDAAIGFFFILIAARIYTIDAVGTAMVLFSYLSFVILASRFGIQQSMIGYYNEKDKSSIYWLTITATTVPAIGLGILLIIFSNIGFLGEDVLAQFSIIFLIGLLLSSVSDVGKFYFLASGNPLIYLSQHIIIGSRILFLVVLVVFGSLGMFLSLIIATCLAAGFSFLIIRRQGVRFRIDNKKFLSESLHFSATNYICDFLTIAPVSLIPIIIFSLFGKEETAIYSVGYSIASIAFFIPMAIGYASFISGSTEKIEKTSKKIIFPTLLLLMGIIAVFFFWGHDIISLLGPNYTKTTDLVVIIMSASVFALFFQIYAAEFKIFREMKKLLILNIAFFVILMSLSIILMMNFGLIGAGYAWIGAYGICVVPMFFYSFLKNNNNASPK